jgi:hypothetical protein
MKKVKGKIRKCGCFINLNRVVDLSRKSKTRHPLLEIFKVKYFPKINRVEPRKPSSLPPSHQQKSL